MDWILQEKGDEWWVLGKEQWGLNAERSKIVGVDEERRKDPNPNSIWGFYPFFTQLSFLDKILHTFVAKKVLL